MENPNAVSGSKKYSKEQIEALKKINEWAKPASEPKTGDNISVFAGYFAQGAGGQTPSADVFETFFKIFDENNDNKLDENETKIIRTESGKIDRASIFKGTAEILRQIEAQTAQTASKAKTAQKTDKSYSLNGNAKLTPLDTGGYKADGKTSAEDVFKHKQNVLSKDAKTLLDREAHVKRLKELGIIDDKTENLAGENEYLFKTRIDGNTVQYYRIVNDNGKEKLISTKMKNGEASVEVYEINDTPAGSTPAAKPSEPSARPAADNTAPAAKQPVTQENPAPKPKNKPQVKKPAKPDKPKTPRKTPAERKKEETAQLKMINAAARKIADGDAELKNFAHLPADIQKKIAAAADELIKIRHKTDLIIEASGRGNGGINAEKLKAVIQDASMTDAQFVSLIEEFNSKKGKTLTKHIAKLSADTKFIKTGLSETDKSGLISSIGKRLASAANSGNDDAVRALCREIRSVTEDSSRDTDLRKGAKALVSAAFEGKIHYTAAKKVNKQYPEVNKGAKLSDDLKTAGIDEKLRKKIEAASEK